STIGTRRTSRPRGGWSGGSSTASWTTAWMPASRSPGKSRPSPPWPIQSGWGTTCLIVPSLPEAKTPQRRPLRSVAVGDDNLAVCAGAARPPGIQGNRVLDEPDTAIGHQSVGTTGVVACGDDSNHDQQLDQSDTVVPMTGCTHEMVPRRVYDRREGPSPNRVAPIAGINTILVEIWARGADTVESMD